MHRYKGRTALISAAADGLGLGIAERLCAEGGNVVVLDVNAEAIDTARQRPGMQGARFEQLDLFDGKAIMRTIAGLRSEGITIDILVNNAGGSLHTPRPFLDASDTDWQRVLDLNIMASVRLTRAVLPQMIQAEYGRIVNLGSKAGRYGSLFTGANYVAAKGAVQSMTLQIAQEFGPSGITCNAVCPGAIMTPRVQRLLAERMSEAEREAVVQSIPMRRNGQVEDVAATVAFLASEEAGFITGQLIDVNGGQGMAS